MQRAMPLLKHRSLPPTLTRSVPQSYVGRPLRGHPFITSTRKLKILTPSPIHMHLHELDSLPLMDIHMRRHEIRIALLNQLVQ